MRLSNYSGSWSSLRKTAMASSRMGNKTQLEHLLRDNLVHSSRMHRRRVDLRHPDNNNHMASLVDKVQTSASNRP